MRRIANGARVHASRNQIAAPTNLIGALTKDEIKEPADTLGGIQDYFDAANFSGENATPASTYGSLPPRMRQNAWPVALARMTLQEPNTAQTWLRKHPADSLLSKKFNSTQDGIVR